MKVTVTGNAIVVTSEVKFDDLVRINKYKPDALCLKDEDDNETFRVFALPGSHQVKDNAVIFGSETRDENKLASLTMFFEAPKDADLKEIITDEFGTAFANLRKIEEKIPGIIEDINKERAEIGELINVSQ